MISLMRDPAAFNQHDTLIVTATQMQAIEERMFAAGFPVAALMEKVAGRISQRIQTLYPDLSVRFGVLVGPGHNGGDALVVARELHLQGYSVLVYIPFKTLKPLTADHARYVESLGIPASDELAILEPCDVLIDGLFGFGLTRSLTGDIATAITTLNQWQKPVLSIDLPSGLHTDTGEMLGTAIRATRTFCLGLWKLGLLQEWALPWVGESERIGFDIPLADIQAILEITPQIQRITPDHAISHLPLHRPVDAHKYQMGHLLLIVGSQQYAGAALLAGLGARASGVGMLTIALPASLKPILIPSLPEALIIGCPETASGALELPPDLQHAMHQQKYSAIAMGPGLTTAVPTTLAAVLDTPNAVLLDADALNIMAQQSWLLKLAQRSAPTVLTPHWGEFKRLSLSDGEMPRDRISRVQQLAQRSQSWVVLKGARTAIANAQGQVWINPASTPALARGGSGDVLSGLLGGLMAQAIAQQKNITGDLLGAGVWWHAQAGLYAAQQQTCLGVDGVTLSQSMFPALQTVSTTFRGA